MTVKDLHDTTNSIVKIHISCGDWVTELNRSNPLELHAYGGYLVREVDPVEYGELLVHVKMIPATK